MVRIINVDGYLSYDQQIEKAFQNLDYFDDKEKLIENDNIVGFYFRADTPMYIGISNYGLYYRYGSFWGSSTDLTEYNFMNNTPYGMTRNYRDDDFGMSFYLQYADDDTGRVNMARCFEINVDDNCVDYVNARSGLITSNFDVTKMYKTRPELTKFMSLETSKLSTLDLTTPKDLADTFVRLCKAQVTHGVDKAVDRTSGVVTDIYSDSVKDKFLNNMEFDAVYEEQKAGVLRENKIKKIYYSLCNSEEKRGDIQSDERMLTIVYEGNLNKEKGIFVNGGANRGEYMKIYGTGTSLDGKELLVSTIGYNHAVESNLKAAPKHHLDNWNYITFVLPMEIRLGENDTIVLNTGTISTTPIGNEQASVCTLYLYDYVVGGWVNYTANYYENFENVDKDITVTIDPGFYTSEELRDEIIKKAKEQSPDISINAHDYSETTRNNIGPYYMRNNANISLSEVMTSWPSKMNDTNPIDRDGTFGAGYPNSFVGDANYEEGSINNLEEEILFETDDQSHIAKQSLLLKDTPLARLMGYQFGGNSPVSRIPFKSGSDASGIRVSPFVRTNGVDDYGSGAPNHYGYLVATQSFDFTTWMEHRNATPLKAEDIEILNSKSTDSNTDQGKITVQRGPLNDSLMFSPNGYVNMIGCLGELQRASSVEVHNSMTYIQTDDVGYYSACVKSYRDIKKIQDKYLSELTDGSNTGSIFQKWQEAEQFLYDNDLAMSMSQYPAHGCEYTNRYQSGLEGGNDWWNGTGRFGDYVDKYLPTDTSIRYKAFGNTSNTSIFSDSTTVNLVERNSDTTHDFQGDIIGYTADLSVPSGHLYDEDFQDLSVELIDISFSNYIEIPLVLAFEKSSNPNITRFTSIPYFLSNDQYTPVAAGYMYGVLKESHVRRILDIPETDTNVPKYGYLTAKQNTHYADGTYSTWDGTEMDYGKYNGIRDKFGTNVLESEVVIYMGYIAEYFNRQGVDHIICDIRNQDGGLTSFSSFLNTFGTKRLKPGSMTADKGDDFTKHANSYFGSVEKYMSEINNKYGSLESDKIDLNLEKFYFDPTYYSDNSECVLGNGQNTLASNIAAGTEDYKQRILCLKGSNPISAAHQSYFDFSGPNGDGLHYFDSDGNGVDGPVEVITMGQCTTPFATIGYYPNLSDQLGDIGLTEDSQLRFVPLIDGQRAEQSMTVASTKDNSCALDLGSGMYHSDFHIDSTMKTWSQDIGFTTDQLLTSTGEETQAFKDVGGIQSVGRPIFSSTQSITDNYAIAPPTVLPNFYDKTTWRDRIMERAVKILNDPNWKDHSLKRNKDTIDEIYDETAKYATCNH